MTTSEVRFIFFGFPGGFEFFHLKKMLCTNCTTHVFSMLILHSKIVYHLLIALLMAVQ